MASKKATLDRLTRVAARLAAVEVERDRAVAAAMAAGCTWAQIGAGLGVSAQAAHRRFRQLRSDGDGTVWREPALF